MGFIVECKHIVDGLYSPTRSRGNGNGRFFSPCNTSLRNKLPNHFTDFGKRSGYFTSAADSGFTYPNGHFGKLRTGRSVSYRHAAAPTNRISTAPTHSHRTASRKWQRLRSLMI
jgi:hypothetical protein